MAGPAPRPTWNSRRPLMIGVTTVALLLVGIGIWSAKAEIAGAVIGTGSIEVSSVRTSVQHPIGGVVVEILKRDGDSVTAGEVILRLDDEALRSDLAVTESALCETLANIARLEAALEGRRSLTVPPLLAEAAEREPQWAELLARLEQQLHDHFAAIDTQMRLLDEQIAQTQAQIKGVEAQRSAAQEELALIEAELVRVQALDRQGLMRTAELTALLSKRAEFKGRLGQFEAQMGELRGKIAESELKRLEVKGNALELVSVELSRLRPEGTRLQEARSRTLADLARLEIRAPVSGRIIGSQVPGLRSVVVAASPLMTIVPGAEPVIARIRVDATDIDQVFLGQQASLRFPSFNGRQTPIILGPVIQVSADAFKDGLTQRNYYEVLVALDPSQIDVLGDHDLIPGMPVEAHLSTESRTPLSYVMRPILFYIDRAFRDT